MVEEATYPLHPTSTGQTFALQPRWDASSTEFSHGTVSSMIYTDLREGDQSTMFGLRLVEAISGGKMSCWPMSTSIFQSRTMTRCPVSGFVGVCLSFTCPSRMKVVVFMGLLGLGGKGVKLIVSSVPVKDEPSCGQHQLASGWSKEGWSHLTSASPAFLL